MRVSPLIPGLSQRNTSLAPPISWRIPMHSRATNLHVFAAAFNGPRISPRLIVRSVISVLFGLLLFATPAFSQVETGQIAGTVTDESGAVVPNATVTVRNLASNAQRATQSSPTGSY